MKTGGVGVEIRLQVRQSIWMLKVRDSTRRPGSTRAETAVVFQLCTESAAAMASVFHLNTICVHYK